MGLGYIRSRRGDTVLEPDEDRKNPVGRICPTGAVATVSGTRWGPDISGWSDISDLVSDMSNLAMLPQLCDPMKISDLVAKQTQQGIKCFARNFCTLITFDGSVVSLLIVRHAYDSKININSFLSRAHQFLFFFLFPLNHNLIFNVLLSTLTQKILAL
jgi:hypothetical protein